LPWHCGTWRCYPSGSVPRSRKTHSEDIGQKKLYCNRRDLRRVEASAFWLNERALARALFLFRARQHLERDELRKEAKRPTLTEIR